MFPDDSVPKPGWSTDRLIEQADKYLASIRMHRTICPPGARSGRRSGCAGYSNWSLLQAEINGNNPSCAEDLAFLYSELGRIYRILADREQGR